MWLDGLMDNVVYALIVIFIGYSVYFYIIKRNDDNEPNQFEGLNQDDEDETPVIQPPDDQLEDMTLEQIQKYNGKEEKKILISVKNIVFDCTKNEMYNPGGSYHLFAGKDASVSLARMSFEEKDMNIYNTEKLTLSELDILEQWFQKFNSKYLRVGRLVQDKKNE